MIILVAPTKDQADYAIRILEGLRSSIETKIDDESFEDDEDVNGRIKAHTSDIDEITMLIADIKRFHPKEDTTNAT